MKRAGGGFDDSFNAQTAVDELAYIIVAAEVVNTSSDVQQLPMVLKAVKEHTGASAAQVLADAGYRSEAVMAELAESPSRYRTGDRLGSRGQGTGQAPRCTALPAHGSDGRQVRNRARKDGLPKAQVDR